MNIISGLYNESEVKIGIVASRFNEIITSKLIDGVADGLRSEEHTSELQSPS